PGSRRFRQAEKKQVVRAAGIEPTSTGWKPVTLPLSYARASGGQPPARAWRLTADRFGFEALRADPRGKRSGCPLTAGVWSVGYGVAKQPLPAWMIVVLCRAPADLA